MGNELHPALRPEPEAPFCGRGFHYRLTGQAAHRNFGNGFYAGGCGIFFLWKGRTFWCGGRVYTSRARAPQCITPGEEAGVRGLVAPPPFPPAYPKSIQSPCGLSLSKSSSEPQSGSQNVLGPVPGVGVMAKRPPGLLKGGDSFPRTPGCFRAHLRG
jgi:hypothetical protein